ncbi:MAG TPA: DUF4381 domain-containing protein [Caldithrix abyssi]|uniref:DUF4381 domain-containing protein n=1 Tax=Caldithrix abyssi TaxID=187145 RepID=A0A7V4U0T9_CALAY|nr:DUF4381 domain-containing protein [Caldithrix abyssi]
MTPDSTKLSQLNDIVVPQPVSWTPQTIGWYFVFALLFLLLVWLGYRLYKARLSNRYRREALAQLELIKQGLSSPALKDKSASRIPELIKRTVLTWAPRDKIAPLYGREWLEFLDHTYRSGRFTSPAGELIEKLSYTDLEQDETENLEQVIPLVADWIKKHKQIAVEGGGRG